MDELEKILKEIRLSKSTKPIVANSDLSVNYSFQPQSLDDENRTVEAVYNTDEPVTRYSWEYGEFLLILSQDAGAVDLKRFNSGRAPLLKDHDKFNIDSVIGKVVSATNTTAKIQFSDDEESLKYYNKVKNGFLGNVSMGVHISELMNITAKYYAETEGIEDENELINKPIVLLATQYQPSELSLVAVPALSDAHVFSKKPLQKTGISERLKTEEIQTMNEKELKRLAELRAKTELSAVESAELAGLEAKVQELSQGAKKPESAKVVSETPKATSETLSAKDIELAVQEESSRVKTIFSLAQEHGFDQAYAQELADKKIDGKPISIKDAKLEILDKAVRTQESKIGEFSGRISVGVSADEKEFALMESALSHRINPSENEFIRDNKFSHMRLLDLAKYCLQKNGVNTDLMSARDIAWQAMASTSDFPKAFQAVVNKSLNQAYTATPRTFLPFVVERTASDFKTLRNIDLSEFDGLDKLSEGGEYKYGTITEGEETYALASFGKIARVTRKMIINDDIGVIARMLDMMGEAVSRMESDQVYAQVLGTGATMADGNPLFHADHNNTVTATLTADASGIDKVDQLLMAQKGPKDKDPLGLTGKYLVYGPKNKLLAHQMLAPINATKAGDNNPYVNEFEPILEHRITNKDYMLFADPRRRAAIEIAYLLGNKNPFTERNVDFKTDSIEFKVRHDFAAKAVDYRAAARGTES